MATSVIELNDCDIRVGVDGRIVLHSPGHAFLGEEGIEIGEPAAGKARLHPRAAHNRYWKNLNQDPLQYPSAHARHHADLAFAQLLNIHELAGKPDEIMLAVPASFTREQLALLLGLVEASPFRATGLVDSAVAATAPIADRGKYAHVDLQLHQAVLTMIDVDERATRTSVQIIENTGLLAIFDSTAHLIADLFIKESRFDPQHHPETEQALYDQIPACMNSLLSHAEVALEVQYQQTQYQAKLPAKLVHNQLQTHYEKIVNAVDKDCSCLLSHQLGRLPGILSVLPNADVLPEQAVVHGCHVYESSICSADTSLSYVTSLPATSEPRISAGATQAVHVPAQQAPPGAGGITHILHDHHAYRLHGDRLYLSASGQINASEDDEKHCSVHLANGGIELVPGGELTVFINGSRLKQVTPLSTGDIVTFAGSKTEYTFIHVSD